MKYLFFLSLTIALFACNGSANNDIKDSSVASVGKNLSLSAGSSANASVSATLDAYYRLKDALVEADTVAVNRAAVELAVRADSIKLEGVSDSALIKTVKNFSGTISAEAVALPQEDNITEKRRAFSMITENLYPLLQSIQYQGNTVYQQMCPMAFNDNEAAYWLSNSREVVNPYLGKKHPKYAAGMLHCGELKDSLNYRK
jgi:hypothetical protein